MTTKPFQWKNLKKISSREKRLFESLFNLLPATGAREKLYLEIRKILMKHLGEKSFFYLESIQIKPYAAFLAELPDTAVMSVIGMEPIDEKAILHLDSNLAFLIIDRLLGGMGDPAVENRKLTETEQGVVQYLIMQILAKMWHVCGKSARVHFRFDRFCFIATEAEKYSAGRDESVSLVFKVGIGELSGFIKMIFPAAFIERASGIAIPAGMGGEEDYLVNKIKKFDYLRTVLWAEAGRLSVTPDDIAGLEAGDVMLFDECNLTLDGNHVDGSVNLKVGSGDSGSLTAGVDVTEKIVKCTISGG